MAFVFKFDRSLHAALNVVDNGKIQCIFSKFGSFLTAVRSIDGLTISDPWTTPS